MNNTFTITAKGLSAGKLIANIEKKNMHVSDWAKEVIKKEYIPTKGTYTLIGISASDMRKEYPTTKEIFDFAQSKGYEKPTIEMALILREKYTQEELEKTGYYYFPVFHEPVRDADGYPSVPVLRRYVDKDWLSGWLAIPTNQWPRENLFLFLQVSQNLKPKSLILEPKTLELVVMEVMINGQEYALVEK